MKKLLLIGVLLAGMSALAQKDARFAHERHGMDDMTPEQMATLSSKRMALALDLSGEQLNMVQELQLQRANERKSFMEARKQAGDEKVMQTSEERFNRMNEMLNRQLAYKDAMKKILNEEQFARWEKWEARKGHRAREFRRHSKHNGRR